MFDHARRGHRQREEAAMIPILMEDWVTVRGNSVTVVQDVSKWLNTGPYQDIFFSVDVREVSGGTTFYLDTAPARDEPLFQPMVGAAGFTPTVGLNFKAFRAADASIGVPVSHWTRWRVSFGSLLSDITFRILVQGNRFC